MIRIARQIEDILDLSPRHTAKSRSRKTVLLDGLSLGIFASERFLLRNYYLQYRRI
jgi:hypothetical protein